MHLIRSTTGKLMAVVHDQQRKAPLAREVKVRCADDACPWRLPEDDADHVRLPNPFPARFKNIVASLTDVKERWPGLPSLFCGDVVSSALFVCCFLLVCVY